MPSSVEHLVVELERAVDIADLAAGDVGRGVQVLGLLLRIVDELGEPEHDLDQLVPVLLLAVELHQLGEQAPVVGALVERGDEVLRGLSAVVQLGRGDVADLDQQLDALVAVGHDRGGASWS